MSSVKEEVRKLLEQLPEEVTLEEVQYHLYVLQKLEQGVKDMEEGRVLDQEMIRKCRAQCIGAEGNST